MADTERPIGLAISGPGHRAAVFALGALLYLTDSGINKRIRTIASASGGSLVNAFLALADPASQAENRKSLNDLSPSEFEKFAAQFAKRMSGHPTWWWATVLSYGVCLVSWLLLTWIALPNSLTFFWQLLFVVPLVILSIAGQFSGGTVWGCWISWFFAGSIIYGITLGALVLLAALLVDPSFWTTGAILIMASVIGSSCRAWVSETALAEAICSTTGGKDLLSDISPGIRHVFCSTELEGGDQAFFCRDGVVVPGLGSAQPEKLRLSTAVQASANVPVTFPPLRLRISSLGFTNPTAPGRHFGKHLLLSDGGIRDGLAASWYLKAKNSVQEPPTQLIIINASTPARESQVGGSWFPPLREFEGLTGLARAIFINEARQQLHDLRTRFSLTASDRLALSGAVASIDENPCRILGHYMGTAVDSQNVIYPERGMVDSRIEAAAHHASDMWRHGQDVEKAREKLSGKTRNIDQQVTVLKRQLWQLENQLKDLQRESFEYRETYEILVDVKKEIIRLDKDYRRQVQEGWEKRPTAMQPEERIKEDAEIEEAVQKNAKVRAHFRPLGKSSTALLLWHGYLSMMINGNIFLGLPMIDHGRTLADFKSLAKGRSRFHALGGDKHSQPRLRIPGLASASSLFGVSTKEHFQGRFSG